ncbi:hypothetical protein [Streptomyces sp. NPDC050704]
MTVQAAAESGGGLNLLVSETGIEYSGPLPMPARRTSPQFP